MLFVRSEEPPSPCRQRKLLARKGFSSAPAEWNLLFRSSARYNFSFQSFMNRIVIAVGSTRKPKLAAVSDALDEVGALLAFTRSAPHLSGGGADHNSSTQYEVVGLEVPSGVTHTP